MKKNLQEAEYREIEGLDIRGQLLENQGTPKDRGDGKPFLMHKLRVMIGPYQKEIPITNQELTKIMNADLQENKNMTLKEMIKKELTKVLQEGADKQPARVGAVRDLLDEFDMNNLDVALIEKGADPKKVNALYRALTDFFGLQSKSDKPLSIKEVIKEELVNALNEGMAGSAPEFDTRNPDAALAQGAIDSEKDKDLINQMEELEKALNQGSEIDTRLLQKLLDDVKEKLGLPTGMGEAIGLGRNPAAYGKGGPNISGASKRFKGVIGDIDDNISEALRLAKKVRDELLPEDPYERNREKAGPHIQAAIKALLAASNVYRL